MRFIGDSKHHLDSGVHRAESKGEDRELHQRLLKALLAKVLILTSLLIVSMGVWRRLRRLLLFL